MPGIHKNPTISFRVSQAERQEIEANIKASGMSKNTYFVRCCIYKRICVVGKKETIYLLVEELKDMRESMMILKNQIESGDCTFESEEIRSIRSEYEDMIKAIIKMLDGARYLWEPDLNNKNGDAPTDNKNISE